MKNSDKYNDPVAYAEEVLGVKLFDHQKTVLRKAIEAREKGQELIIHYPYRHGRTIMNRAWNEFLETR